MKTCPLCAEEIQDAAIRCRWCHRDLARRGVAWPLAAALGLGALATLLAAASPARSVDESADGAFVTTAGAKRCPALSALPPGHPPISGAEPQEGPRAEPSLPPGHPPVAGALPPGHPPVPAAPAVPIPVADPRPLVRTYAL